MPNIVKHSYIKGPKIAARATAHINYIQHRPGEDKQRSEKKAEGDREGREQARPLHVKGEENLPPGKASRDFKQAMYDKDQRGRVVHKFVLSPSENGVNMDKYTQEVMDAIGRHKGQDLQYGWVTHSNTDNPHAHVVVLGKDSEGSQVRFTKLEYSLMRTYGDRYLEREHGVELNLAADHQIELYARTHSHNLYTATHEQNLKFLESPQKERSWKSDEDFRHLLLINRNWNESLEGPSREGGLMLGSTWLHDRGRLTEVHDLFQNASDRDLWKDVLNNASDQDIKEYAERQLTTLDEQRQAVVAELGDKLGLTPDKHEQFFKDIQEQFAEEWKEIDQVLYPEKYQPQGIDRDDIDLTHVNSNDKIQLHNGEWITKYDSSEYLNDVRSSLYDLPFESWLDRDEFGKLCSWIGAKRTHGEDCFGAPPLKIEQDIDKSLDVGKIDSREVSLDGLSEELALSSKSIQDLIKPTYDHPELRELDSIAESHDISIGDKFDARDPNPKAIEEALADIERDEPDIDIYSIEHELRGDELEQAYEVSYDIEMPDDIDEDHDMEVDFFGREESDWESDESHEDQSNFAEEVEPFCNIEENGGEEYELDEGEPDRNERDDDNDRDDDHHKKGDRDR